MEASLCCHKYHGKETPAKPTCPTVGPTHLTAEPSLANDFHIFFLYIYFKIYELNNIGFFSLQYKLANKSHGSKSLLP